MLTHLVLTLALASASSSHRATSVGLVVQTNDGKCVIEPLLQLVQGKWRGLVPGTSDTSGLPTQWIANLNGGETIGGERVILSTTGPAGPFNRSCENGGWGLPAQGCGSAEGVALSGPAKVSNFGSASLSIESELFGAVRVEIRLAIRKLVQSPKRGARDLLADPTHGWVDQTSTFARCAPFRRVDLICEVSKNLILRAGQDTRELFFTAWATGRAGAFQIVDSHWSIDERFGIQVPSLLVESEERLFVIVEPGYAEGCGGIGVLEARAGVIANIIVAGDPSGCGD
jgi:hypothetical protein